MATTSTVGARLRYWSRNDPERSAYIFRSENSRIAFTREEMFTLASRYAGILRRKGIRQGDVVCNTLPNSPERLLTDLGIMLAGGVAMNGQVFLADGADFVGTIKRSGCVAVVTDPGQPLNAIKVLENRLAFFTDNDVKCPDAPSLKLVLQIDCKMGENGKKPFLEELQKEQESFVADVKPTDPAFIFTTSGSTGFSKLVLRSHASFLALGDPIVHMTDLQSTDIFFNDRSLGWLGGAPLLYLRLGSTRVLVDASSTSKDPLGLAWQVIKSEACTGMLLVPLHIDMTIARPDLWKDLTTKPRFAVTGGQPVKKQHTDIVGKLADSLVILYGSTEAGFVTSRQVHLHDKDAFEDGDNGLPLPGVEVKFVDENSHEVLKAGQAGELLVRGPTVFTGYFGTREDVDQEQTNVFTEDGFFRTSDVAFRGPSGGIHVVCRQSNAIIHGAFIVYPGWLESRIERCPGVQSVIIVPVPDPTLYQELCACVVPQPGATLTADDVRDFCKSLFLVSETSEMSQVPRYYVFFDAFPSTSTGKTDRKAILTTALDRLGIPASITSTTVM
nr:hypothetical protein BaRGS_026279 [Batillaria attramentaria]